MSKYHPVIDIEKVKIYILNINVLNDPLESGPLKWDLGPGRMKKVLKPKSPDGRKRSLAGSLILNKILEDKGLKKDVIQYAKRGKPIADGVFFNISHSGDYAVGVYADKEAGCDVELIRKYPEHVAARFFDPEELKFINDSSDSDKAFFYLWTLKESYLKMNGEGISGLDRLKAVFPHGGLTRLDPGGNSSHPVLNVVTDSRCFFVSFLQDRHIISICIRI